MHASKADLQSLHTLKKRADFLAVQKHGRKWVSRGLILQVKPNSLGFKRVGFTVSKRTNKSAVKRNRIKRRLRAAAAETLPHNAQNSTDYVLVGRPLTLTRPYTQLIRDLKWCLGKLDCLETNDKKPYDYSAERND